MTGMTKIPETGSSAPGVGGIPKFALAICACLLLTVAITLTGPSRPGFAQSSVEEMIAEYQQLLQERKKAIEIIENEQNYSQSEVEKAIEERSKIDQKISGLHFRIKDRGGKFPWEKKPDQGEGAKPDAEQKPAAEAELELTDGEKGYIKKQKYLIRKAQEKLKQYGQNSKQGKIQKEFIEKLKNRIRDTHASAKRTIHVSPDSSIGGEHDEESVKKKTPKVDPPWKLGHWPWRFDKTPETQELTFLELRFTELELSELKKKYFDLQQEMGATLLIRRDTWTYQKAVEYNEKLKVLCALIIDTEERIAFGLGDPVKFGRAIRTKKQKWRLYLNKQKDTDAKEAVMKATEAKWHALLKKSGLKPGDTVPSDDPNAQKLNQLAAMYVIEAKLFLEVRKISELAKYASGVISDAIKQRIKDGIAFTADNPPKLEIHRKCGSGESSIIYKMFLDPEQLKIFEEQGNDRYKKYLEQNR
jgi:hypothetical protein